MKIYELIEGQLVPSHTKHSDEPLELPNDNSSIRDKQEADELEKYGAQAAGSYYMGKSHPQDPHMYHKKLILPTDQQDPVFAYYQAIEQLKGSNPWLPLVYKTEVAKDPSNPQITQPSYEMERLYDFTEVPSRLVMDTIRHIVNGEQRTPKIEKFINKINKATDVQKRLYLYVDLLLDILLRGSTKEINIQDPNLKQACDIVYTIYKSNPQFRPDLHSGNIMWRKTSFGIQPVIVDPIVL